MNKYVKLSVIGALLCVLQACVPHEQPTTLLDPTGAQINLRNFQTRAFDVQDRYHAVRAVIAALQDLGFIVERADGQLGFVTAGKLGEPGYRDLLELTVTVRTKSKTQMEFRVNAILNTEPINNPELYQNFFTVLEHNLFVVPER